MFLGVKNKLEICEIILHISLIMYGDAILQFSRDESNEIDVLWASIGEGGDPYEKGETSISECDFQEIINFLFGISFPEQENDQMTRSWEIIIENSSGDVVACIKDGYWDDNLINEIISKLESIIKDPAPFQGFKEIISA